MFSPAYSTHTITIVLWRSCPLLSTVSCCCCFSSYFFCLLCGNTSNPSTLPPFLPLNSSPSQFCQSCCQRIRQIHWNKVQIIYEGWRRREEISKIAVLETRTLTIPPSLPSLLFLPSPVFTISPPPSHRLNSSAGISCVMIGRIRSVRPEVNKLLILYHVSNISRPYMPAGY